jgi:hypothetical protein
LADTIKCSSSCIVDSEEEFDEYVAERFYQLLDHSSMQIRRVLRETNQWQNDIVHEKLAQRWGYELLERFVIDARSEVPCRPIHLLDSFIFRYFSKRDTSLRSQELGSPAGRFLDGLFSSAVHSRDAVTAIFYHLYGLGQREVVKLLGLGPVESQRVYKNYLRWRSAGWRSMIEDVGLRDSDMSEILEQERLNPHAFQNELQHLIGRLQSHYRKSEPAYYPCLSRTGWEDLYKQDTGYDYKGWHLPFCQACFYDVWELRHLALNAYSRPHVKLRLYPLAKAGVLQSCLIG